MLMQKVTKPKDKVKTITTVGKVVIPMNKTGDKQQCGMHYAAHCNMVSVNLHNTSSVNYS